MEGEPLEATRLEQAAAKLRLWRAEPARFVWDTMGVEPDGWQCEVLLAAAAGMTGVPNAVNPECLMRLALKASKGPGKSAVDALVAWWAMVCFPHLKGVCTSVTGPNLRDGLWAELAKWRQRSALLKAKFSWHAERIVAVDHPETWFLSSRQWSKSASAEQQADTLAGIHADNILIIVDESGGVPDGVVAAAEAGLANVDRAAGRHALLVQSGNPTHLTGPLHRACSRERALWWIKEISGDPDDPNRAPRVSEQWAREQIQKFGRDNPWVLVNVFGRFPPNSIDTLLGIEDVTTAVERRLPEVEFAQEPKVLGVDVARFGDDETCILMRQGPACFQPKYFRNIDTMQTAGQVVQVIDKHRPDAVFIDADGLGGGVVDRLRELRYPVTGVHSAGKASSTGTERFLNKRAEMWFSMADWVKKRGALPDDAMLRSELPEPKYWFTSKGELQLESKEMMKARGIASPNRADALALTFAMPVAHRDIRAGLGAGRTSTEHEYNPYER